MRQKPNPYTYTHKDGVLYRDDKVVKGFCDPKSGRKLVAGKDFTLQYGDGGGWWAMRGWCPGQSSGIKVII